MLLMRALRGAMKMVIKLYSDLWCIILPCGVLEKMMVKQDEIPPHLCIKVCWENGS